MHVCCFTHGGGCKPTTRRAHPTLRASSSYRVAAREKPGILPSNSCGSLRMQIQILSGVQQASLWLEGIDRRGGGGGVSFVQKEINISSQKTEAGAATSGGGGGLGREEFQNTVGRGKPQSPMNRIITTVCYFVSIMCESCQYNNMITCKVQQTKDSFKSSGMCTNSNMHTKQSLPNKGDGEFLPAEVMKTDYTLKMSFATL